MQSFHDSEESLRDAPLPEHHPTESHQQASYLAYPIKQTFSSVLRRVSADQPVKRSAASSASNLSTLETSNGVYTPPRGPTPPFNPPPLSPLVLKGHKPDTPASAQILSSLLGEEIRLLFPARLQLCDSWKLAFSLDGDGASLSTLYHKCDVYSGTRSGFILVVKDASGSIFGAYLTDAPRPSNGHYYGTGECFLWRASILPALPSDQDKPLSPQEEEDLLLANLPPPPSADTTNMQRWTTVGSPEAMPVHHHHQRDWSASPPRESWDHASRSRPSLDTQIAPLPAHQQPSLLDMSPEEEFGDFESFEDEQHKPTTTTTAPRDIPSTQPSKATNGDTNQALNVTAGHFSTNTSSSNTHTAQTQRAPISLLNVPAANSHSHSTSTPTAPNAPETPSRLRFRAFPYSGINDYLIFCEPSFLSVGGGDGHYGLWLDSALEHGVSEHCPTFGNEGLSGEDSVPGGVVRAAPRASARAKASGLSAGGAGGDAGAAVSGRGTPTTGHGRFEVLGVEVWVVGS